MHVHTCTVCIIYICKCDTHLTLSTKYEAALMLFTRIIIMCAQCAIIFVCCCCCCSCCGCMYECIRLCVAFCDSMMCINNCNATQECIAAAPIAQLLHRLAYPELYKNPSKVPKAIASLAHMHMHSTRKKSAHIRVRVLVFLSLLF